MPRHRAQRNGPRFGLPSRLARVLTLALAFATASPALAVTDYVVVTEILPADSIASKSLVVDCPAGLRVLGGGTQTFVGGALPQLTPAAIWMSVPFGTPATAWSGAAYHADATSSAPWGLRVDAICGIASGHERVQATSPASSNDSRFVIAGCPDGKDVIGGGIQTTGAVSQTALLESADIADSPYGVDPAWVGVARGPAAPTWGLITVALCTTETEPARVYTTTMTTTAATLTHVTECPAGLVAASGGVRAENINNSVATDAARWTALGPSGPDHAPTGWTATVRRPIAADAEWRLGVDVVCVPEASAPSFGAVALAALAWQRRRSR